MANSNNVVYAVVDKSKKREKNSLPEKQITESTLPNSFDSPVYDATEFSAEDLPAPERNEAIDSEYSMITLDNMYSTLNQTNRLTGAAEATRSTNQGLSQATTTKAEKIPEKKKARNDGTGCKTLACFFITIAVVAIIMLICLAILFAEVRKLNTQTASMQQSPLGQQTADNSNFELQLQQINQSLSNVKDMMQMENIRLQDHLNDSVDKLGKLNMSIGSLYQELDQAYSTLDNHTEQLNSSIEENADNIQALNRTIQKFDVIQQLIINSSGRSQALPVPSCAALKALSPSTPSGYYWVRASNGSAISVYCDMTRSCGGVTGGWMRVAELDMTNISQQCPSGFTRTGTHFCRRSSSREGCSSVDFPTHSFNYTHTCGSITGRGIGSPDAFSRRVTPTISRNYVDGVSLTHGNLRQHIWTFAAGNCPCNRTNSGRKHPPPEVGNSYFCDTGDLNWDGNCQNSNSCCSFNNPPWFYKQLPQPTTDDIEVRVCRDQDRGDEDVQIQIIEIYIQ